MIIDYSYIIYIYSNYYLIYIQLYQSISKPLS